MNLRRNWCDEFEESFEIDVDSLVGCLLAVGDMVRAEQAQRFNATYDSGSQLMQRSLDSQNTLQDKIVLASPDEKLVLYRSTGTRTWGLRVGFRSIGTIMVDRRTRRTRMIPITPIPSSAKLRNEALASGSNLVLRVRQASHYGR